MGKIILTTVLALMLAGCDFWNVRTDTQTVKVPILYCPAPSHIDRPTLPIHTMTDAQLKSDGEVVKHYNATVVVLLGYVAVLEHELDKYNISSAAYNQMKQDVLEKIKKGEIDPISERIK